MNGRISTCLCIVAVIFISDVIAQKDSDCFTPNKESAKCIPIRSCKIIVEAVRTRNQTAIQFARDSQCGVDDGIPLVCCGTTGYYTTASDDFVLSIFNPPDNKKTSQQEKKELETVILQTFKTKALPDRTVCGLEKDDNRIWGGTQTELDEFPWMVALEYKRKPDNELAGVRCGGSLINNRYVLTAAHCLLHREFELTNVRLGEWDLTMDPDCQTLVANVECADKVVKVDVAVQIPHPFYSKRTGNNDIGLIRLAKDISYSDYIRPICLPPENLPAPPYNSLLTVAGWGITENNTASDIKLKVDIPLLTNDICKEKLDSKPVTANQLCAGGDYGKDSCKGDSGGPLMRTYEDQKDKQSQWYQEGVVSLGVGCARAGYPAVYTRVNRYVNWIINNISEE
ncbi:hypothetical protein ILUMI_07448 [Ignelater luminosus]|uniref:CLIP domain-containing serine protease n=1 Tax=Ignelater luminosus TaxID=2038154 RepID=A0A8K0D836_IGNLU|nr:hypothetical protein ILUMI_07448 [Ignelater luminosus]